MKLAQAIRLALIGAATAALSGCATSEPTSVAWQHQSAYNQHRYMPSATGAPAQVASTGTNAMGAAAATPPPEAAYAVLDGDTVRLVSKDEYARLRSNPQALGGPPAPAQPGAAPGTPATK